MLASSNLMMMMNPIMVNQVEMRFRRWYNLISFDLMMKPISVAMMINQVIRGSAQLHDIDHPDVGII